MRAERAFENFFPNSIRISNLITCTHWGKTQVFAQKLNLNQNENFWTKIGLFHQCVVQIKVQYDLLLVRIIVHCSTSHNTKGT